MMTDAKQRASIQGAREQSAMLQNLEKNDDDNDDDDRKLVAVAPLLTSAADTGRQLAVESFISDMQPETTKAKPEKPKSKLTSKTKSSKPKKKSTGKGKSRG